MKLDDEQVSKLTLQEFRPCQQEECAFNKLGTGCQSCEECSAASYDIRRGCDRCFACENVPDALRWGGPVLQEKLMQARRLREAAEKQGVKVEQEKEVEVTR